MNPIDNDMLTPETTAMVKVWDWSYVKSLRSAQPQHFVGHNPR